MRHLASLLLLLLVTPATALAQGGSIRCEDVPTYFPRGDHWAIQPGEIIYYLIHSSGSADVSGGHDLAAVQRAFATWNDYTCAGGGEPNLDVQYGGTTSTRSRGDTRDANDNLTSVSHVVYWIESGWPFDSQTVALTSTLFAEDTGVTVTADMEFNGQHWQWRARDGGGSWTGCNPSSSTCYDIETVALHEFGHFIGLNHVDCTDAVMYPQGSNSHVRTELSIHEQTALCNLYVPRPAGYDATTRYTGEQCSDNGQCPDGLCIFPAGMEGTGWGWCTKPCDCTDGCANNCPQAFICAWRGVNYCKPGVHLTGGATTGGCTCDAGSGCTSGCSCDPDCTAGCVNTSDCADGKVCISQTCTNCTSSTQCIGGKVCLGGRCSPCTSSYQCSATKVCASGACTDCENNAQCLGQVCIFGDCLDCTDNDECDGGRVCVNDRCQDCANSNQCTGGLVCTGGRCSACSTSCPNGQVCISGSCEDCTSSTQCPDGLVCVSDRCTACTSSSQCTGGQVCLWGECSPCTGPSQCGTGQVCAAGVCTGCTSSAQCIGGQVCSGDSCIDCSHDNQCDGGQVCDPYSHRCEDPPESGGGTVDPDTGLSLDFGAPCTSGPQCASGICITDDTEARCTQGCIPAGLPGGGTPDEACPTGFDCMETDFSAFVCWPLDPAAWDGGLTQSRATLNELCYLENGVSTSDDWYMPCAPELGCFAFVPRCEGREGACVRYCNESLPCPEPNQTCCYDVDAAGNCLGPAPDRDHGGCFEIRIEGESCVAAEQSICDNGLGCYHFGNPALAKCYRRCDGAPCLPGASCNSFTDGCGNEFDLCCADADLPAACSPGRVAVTRLDLGFTCSVNDDCDSGLCASYAGQSGCSRSCNPVTGGGCPDESYDADGDGIADGGFDCIEAGAGTGFCWPRQGPLAVEVEPEPEPEESAPPPPKGLCAAAGSHGSWVVALGLVVLGLRRRR